mgnify:CR=1 FL=1
MEQLNVTAPCDIKPNLSANALFNFMTESRFLYKALETKALIQKSVFVIFQYIEYIIIHTITVDLVLALKKNGE